MSDIWYSTNGEDYGFDNMVEAAEHAVEFLGVGETASIWEGEAVHFTASDFARVDTDDLCCNAADTCGEHAHEWPGATNEQSEDLAKRIKSAVDAWAEEHNLQPVFFSIRNAKQIVVRLTDADGGYEIVQEGEST
jgi:hypothetical protein